MALKRTGFSEESKARSREKALAKQREKGRKPMKRSAPKKRGRNDQGQSHDIIKQAEIDAKRRFHDAARKQKVCARCGTNKHWDAHHVVEKQWLKTNGFSVVEQYDPDNALRVCDELAVQNCHGKHTTPVRDRDRLHLRNLKRCNLEYAFRVMGPAAGNYLRRKYRGEDTRLDELEKEHEH
jgi:hypothetical protein